MSKQLANGKSNTPQILGVYSPSNDLSTLNQTNILEFGSLEELCLKSIKSSILHKIGIPVSIFVDALYVSDNNQLGTYLTIDEETGLGYKFSNAVLIFREDGKDLNIKTILNLHDYMCDILDSFPEEKHLVHTKVDRQYFSKYMEDLIREQILKNLESKKQTKQPEKHLSLEEQIKDIYEKLNKCPDALFSIDLENTHPEIRELCEEINGLADEYKEEINKGKNNVKLLIEKHTKITANDIKSTINFERLIEIDKAHLKKIVLWKQFNINHLPETLPRIDVDSVDNKTDGLRKEINDLSDCYKLSLKNVKENLKLLVEHKQDITVFGEWYDRIIDIGGMYDNKMEEWFKLNG